MSATEELAKQVLRSMEGLVIRAHNILGEMGAEEREIWRSRFHAEAQNLTTLTDPDTEFAPPARRATDAE